jgi:hypothetical protein
MEGFVLEGKLWIEPKYLLNPVVFIAGKWIHKFS